MNVVLIGYRGTGKSTLGKMLAQKLGLEYVSLDDEIVRRAGMSIPEIVERNSWEHFRDIEQAVVEEFAARTDQVLDTGGGAITREKNIEELRGCGTVFLLESTVDDIVKRIGGDTQRPSLTGTKSFVDEVREVLEERNPLYHRAAHHVVDTSALAAEPAVEQIVAIWTKGQADV